MMEKKKEVIDFHTHIFPNNIAIKAIPILENNGHILANTNGCLSGLVNSMKKANISYSLALPVATKETQVISINNFAINVNNHYKEHHVLSFGGMHPLFQDYKNELDRLKENGILGIKLHPEYQNTYIDDKSYIDIIDYAFSIGLMVIIHAGIDIGIDSDIKASPDRILNCKNQLKHEGIFILAHMGSWDMWDLVYDKILGKGFYIDTAFSLGEISYKNNIVSMFDEKKFKEFILKQGADYILFATDSPWADQEDYMNKILNMNIEEEVLDKILFKNAKKLLKIED